MPLKKILLVDDSQPFNFLNRLILQQNGVKCQIDEALDGEQALNYISDTEECPDVILLDLNMPVLDGFQFLTEYKKRGKCCSHTKIYILTSSALDEDRNTALSNDLVKGYFDKPLTAEYIQSIVSSF